MLTVGGAASWTFAPGGKNPRDDTAAMLDHGTMDIHNWMSHSRSSEVTLARTIQFTNRH